jgi:hypothetical protein
MANTAIIFIDLCEKKLHNCEFDHEAYVRYPDQNWIYNKLILSKRLGYDTGPGGVSVAHDGDYVVRPIINLSGMGVGARRVRLAKGDYSTVPPGYFWCEYFHGVHTTIDYKWEPQSGTTNSKLLPQPIFAANGYRTSQELYRFSAWKKIDPPLFKLPEWINELICIPRFNIEFINGKIIEMHLRPGVDFPDASTEIIPHWNDMPAADCEIFSRLGYDYRYNFDDADGHLAVKRLGFFFK